MPLSLLVFRLRNAHLVHSCHRADCRHVGFCTLVNEDLALDYLGEVLRTSVSLL